MAISAALLALLLSLPGLEGWKRTLRMAFPMANVERVSRTRWRILEPSPPDLTVPRGDAVAIVAQVEGRPVNEAVVETRTDGRSARLRMRPLGGGRFAASLDARYSTLRYRVRGGDGMTRWYTVEAVPPPQVVAFEKTYSPPAYMPSKPRTVQEPHGDIEGLEGTRVRVRIEVDQPVKTAELRLRLDGEEVVQGLEPEDPLHWATELELNRSGMYEVRLVAARTGFENRARPVYELRVVPDLIPQVEFVEPAQDVTLAADDVLRLKAEARDDVGLARVQRMLQVARRGWTPDGDSVACTGTLASVETVRDLLSLQLKPGDQVLIKFVAEDLKGNRGESTVRRVWIVGEGFEPDRRRILEAWQQIRSAMERLKAAVEEARAALEKYRTAAAKSPNSPETAQARAQLVMAVRRAIQVADTARQTLTRALDSTPAGARANELSLLASSLSRIRHEQLGLLDRWLTQPSEFKDDTDASPVPGWANEQMDRAVQAATRLERSSSALVAAEQTEVLILDLADAQRELMRLVSAKHRAAGTQMDLLTRREAVLAQRLRTVMGELSELQKRSSGRGEFKDMARRLEEVLRNAPTPEALPEQPAWAMQPRVRETIESVLTTLVQISEDVRQQVAEHRRQLVRQNVDALPLETLERVVQARRGAQSDARRRRWAQVELEEIRDAVAAEFRDAASFEELRRDANRERIREWTVVASALKVWSPRWEEEDAARNAVEWVRSLTAAVRKSAGVYTLSDAARHTATLGAHERWGRPDDRQVRSRAHEWSAIYPGLPELGGELRARGFSPEVQQELNAAHGAPEARRADEEMQVRQRDVSGRQNVAAEVAWLAEKLAALAARLAEEVAPSRQWILAQAPSLSQQLAHAAEEARRIREQTEQAAESSTEKTPSAPELARLLAKQQQFNEQLEEIRQALRAEAAAQDLRTEEGRERARDADDGLAMLREPPPRAEDWLRRADQASSDAERRSALEQAAGQQKKIESSLETLADHFARLEQGDAQGRRADLRQAEAEAGIADALQREYERAARLAEGLSGPLPGPSREALEAELQQNPAMQAALDRLSRELLANAAARMQQVAERESELSQSVRELAQRSSATTESAAQQAVNLAKAIQQLAVDHVQPATEQAAKGAPEASSALQSAAQQLAEAAQTVPRSIEAANRASAANALEQTASALRRAAQSAGEAARQASNAESASRQAGRSDAAESARSAAQHAGEAARGAAELARQAEETARSLRETAAQEQSALAQGSQEQSGMVHSAAEAGRDVERAGMHQQRLQRNVGQQWAEAGQRVQQTAAGEMTQAAQAMASSPEAARAVQPTDTAALEASRRAQELSVLLEAMPPAMSEPTANPAELAMAEWLARALDQLDAAAQSQSSAPAAMSEGAQAAAQQALAQATTSHQSAMARARSQGQVPGTVPSQGAPAHVAGREGPEVQGDSSVRVPEDWARLPPEMAREMREADRESVPEEYRALVDLYFKILAQEAQRAVP
jgi:hypothetical protein